MSLVGQWQELQAALPPDWAGADIGLELRSREEADRAAALLGPAQPYRATPTTVRFASARDGSRPSPDSIARLLRRLDDARVIGRLARTGARAAAPRAEPAAASSLVDSWDAALAGLPGDWTDLYGEVRLLSSDYVEPAAVLCVPMNPRREGRRNAFRFRCARRAGYGVSPVMARRCLARCDEAGIRGSVEVLAVISDTQLVATQGPTWLLAGRNV